MTKAHAHIVNLDAGAKRSKASSLIARCTAPFATKQRSHIEQEIKPDEPFRQYTPGDTVKGAILVTFGKPLRITHLVIRLHGFVKVFNRAKLPGEELSCDENRSILVRDHGKRGMENFRNGYTRLFEEETVLCGEGRVSGQYDFRFELVLPSKRMPSSIDFEHGTISYMITSTITRPATIAPTTIQHFKLHVQEAIDVAPIPKPKPVALSIASSRKNGKAKPGVKNRVVSSTSERTSKSSSRDSTTGLPRGDTVIHRVEEEPPRSPAPSVTSATTATTSSASSSANYPGESRLCNSTEDLSMMSNSEIVSAKTELLQGGCLAGDALLLRISIKHDKPVKSMQGIIVTFYRQGNINTQPARSLESPRNGEKPPFEDSHPRSRTGLGGLSLNSAGSNRSFRQDLNQIFVPIIIDPQSLTAVINTSIQAPADIFPSITNVPGAMVSFRYFLEIVLDLRGKLSGQDRLRPHLSMTSTPQHDYDDPKVSRCEGKDGVSYLSTPGFNYLITDQLRRTKGVVSTKTEVIVGTRDSSRRRGKPTEVRPKIVNDGTCRDSVGLGREQEPERILDGNARHENILEEPMEQRQTVHDINVDPIVCVPLPDLEEDLDEKAQMRRYEQRLLPSAPPPGENAPSASTVLMPSAPPAIDEEDFQNRYALEAPAPAYDGQSMAHAERIRETFQSHRTDGSLQIDRVTVGPQDDKQELEHRRLLALASSPDYSSVADQEGNTPRAVIPTAPVLYEDDIFSIHDPRIPESSPADFIDDGYVPEEQPHSVEGSAPLTNEDTNQEALIPAGVEYCFADGSHEDQVTAPTTASQQDHPSAERSMPNVDTGERTHARGDVGTHDENIAVNSR